MDRYSGLLLQVIRQAAEAYSLKLSADDVDDLCADTMAELLQRDMAALRDFQGRSSLAVYLAVIARRIVIRRLKEQRYRQAFGHVDAHKAAVEATSGERSPADRAEEQDRVDQLMQILPEESRQLLRAIYLDGLSYAEAARRLGRPENSIGPLLARIRARYGQLPGLH